MLAALQRFLTLSLLAAALGWLLYFGCASPLLAIAGFVVMLLGYSAFFAVEFMLVVEKIGFSATSLKMDLIYYNPNNFARNTECRRSPRSTQG